MNNKPILEDLQVFCTVAKNLSFSATAKELGVSPAYVSKRIGLLESGLGVRLLHRTTRRVRLNADGEAVLGWAHRVLEDAEQLAEAIRSVKTEPRGLLRITTSSGFGMKRIAPALSELALRYPALRIQLELHSRPVDLIGEGFDLDLRIGGAPEPNLIIKHIAANARVLCAAPAYLERRGAPAALAELEQHDCIVVRDRDHAFGVWELQGPQGLETVHVSGPLSCNNAEIANQWALAGHGIALRSTWDVAGKLKDGLLSRVLPQYRQDAPIMAVYPMRLTESARVRACVEFLQQRLGGAPGE